MALDASALGTRGDAVRIEWHEPDVMLYALAVGAGQTDPYRELQLTTENSHGVALQVLPTFGFNLASVARPNVEGLDRTKFLHIGQALMFAEPLRPSGIADVTSEVVGVFDKGGDAILITEQTVRDAASGAAILVSRETLLVRDAGGFGGDRGPTAAPSAIPSGDPDVRLLAPTRPDQALLYRLTGDFNPIHSDPWAAREAGLERPILHGMCTLGVSTRLLINALLGEDPTVVRSLDCRFTRPVLPGDEIAVRGWRTSGGISFQALVGDHVVIDSGRIECA